MAFASGQTVTASMLNRITRNDIQVVCSSSLTVTTEAVIPGLTTSITTPQANTKIVVTASLDVNVSGSGDFLVVRLYVNGASVPGDINRDSTSRGPASHQWTVTVASASTFTVELKAQKISGTGTTTIFSGHSHMNVSGNGIS